ncbi:hypothetical protein MKW92_048012 [Papaver armeniacum]|nr:hypothetical protein MKW92_003650 [Papaver armeniacum]KAI3864896.1 hypothetical protein MKW92_048012 [Papaver armeniacum]
MGTTPLRNIIAYFFLFSILVSKGSSIFDPVTVQVQNDIEGDHVLLKIHCKSLDDDLGEHVLSFGNEWDWFFRVGFGRTKFWCDYRWYDNKDQRWYQGTRVVFKGGLFDFDYKYVKICRRKCIWSARRDGLYLCRRDKEGIWEKRFTWDP